MALRIRAPRSLGVPISSRMPACQQDDPARPPIDHMPMRDHVHDARVHDPPVRGLPATDGHQRHNGCHPPGMPVPGMLGAVLIGLAGSMSTAIATSAASLDRWESPRLTLGGLLRNSLAV